MARERAADARFDFRGGVNTTSSDEILSTNEVRRAANCRCPEPGALKKITGSRRVHDHALLGAVMGLWQWDAPAHARQLVALANGNLSYLNEGGADFTSIGTAVAIAARARFATHRIGSSIKLFIACGTLYVWDGAAITAVAGAPAALDCRVYKGRLFAHDGTKTLYASKVADPLTWAPGSGGFKGDVETYDTEGLQGIEVVGSSLLLCKEDSVARFTGVDQNTIQIDTETEGVSNEAGLVAPATLIGLEGAAFGMSDRGPWLATEAALDLNSGLKVRREFEFANRALWSQAVAVHHRRRHEIWVVIPAAGEGQNDTGWIWNYRNNVWTGPITSLNASALARYKRADRSESFVRGGYDGFICDMDIEGTGAFDAGRDGSGGHSISIDIALPPTFGGDPSRLKSFRGGCAVEADLVDAGGLDVVVETELGTAQASIASRGPGVRNYPFKVPGGKGARPSVSFRDTAGGWDFDWDNNWDGHGNDEVVQLNGVVLAPAIGRKGR